MGFKPIPMAIAVAIGLLIWFVVPVPQGVTPDAWHMLALFVGTIAAIIGKAMPIGALSMLAIALVAVTGVTSDKPATAIADALSKAQSAYLPGAEPIRFTATQDGVSADLIFVAGYGSSTAQGVDVNSLTLWLVWNK